MKVDYTCRICDTGFIREQDDPEPDEDIDMCQDCLNVIFTNREHGSFEDPWTKDLILQVRFGR